VGEIRGQVRSLLAGAGRGPLTEAPEAVRNQASAHRLCVMFLGPPVSKKRERDYGWIAEGSVLPFLEYLVK